MSSREEKFYRVIQAVHDSMELCIQPTSKKIKWEYYFPNGSCTLSPVRQYIAAVEFNVFKQLYGMNTIVIIAS